MKLGKEFENITSNIFSQLSPDAEIKSPDKIVGVNSGIPREIDISIKFKKGLTEILIMVECRDRTRRCGLKYIEQLNAKKADVRASKVIVVSRSGYTKTAIKIANIFGFDLFELNKVGDFDWNNFINNSEVIIRTPTFSVINMDFLLDYVNGIPPVQGYKIIDESSTSLKLYDQNGNRLNYSLINLIEFNLNRGYEKIKNYFPDVGKKELNFEAIIRFPLFVKYDNYLRPVGRLKGKLNIWKEQKFAPINLHQKRILRNSFSGDKKSIYTEFSFNIDGKEIPITIIQGDIAT